MLCTTGPSKFVLVIGLTISLLASGFPANALGDTYQYARKSLVKAILGSQWKFDQYCNKQYSDEEINDSDATIQQLYNGSLLKAIDGSANWPDVLTQLNRLEEIGYETRQRLSISCEPSAWGYADPAVEWLANEPHNDDSECRNQLYALFRFVKMLASQVGLTRKQDCRPDDLKSGCQDYALVGNVSSEPESNFNAKLWQQFHAFGRPPSGPPFQQHLMMGDYDGCQQLDSTRFCWGAYGRTDAQRTHLIGMCLPRMCSSKFLRDSPESMGRLNELIMNNLPDTMKAEETSSDSRGSPRHRLTDVFCPPAEDSLYSKLPRDKLALFLVFLPMPWAFMLVYATFIRKSISGRPNEKKKSKNVAHPGHGDCETVIDSFDLSRNWAQLTRAAHLDERLVGLNGVKMLAMLWLMATHLSMIIFPFTKNINQLNEYYMTNLHGPILLQGQHGVPVFFLVSGLLFGFKYLNRERVNVKQMILWRYFRLLPMYLLVYSYVKKFVHLFGSGPLWDYGVSRQSDLRQCMLESWTIPLLMLSNFAPPMTHCLVTGWHIANDFQICLVLPFLLMAYRHSRRRGALVALGAFAITHASHMWLWGTSHNWDLFRLMREPVRLGPRIILDRVSFDYVNPVGRLGTYFMGVLLADLLLVRQRRLQQSQLSPKQQQQQQQQRQQHRRRRRREKQDTNEEVTLSAVKADQQQPRSYKPARQADKTTSFVPLTEPATQPKLGGQLSELAQQRVNVAFYRSSSADGHQQQIEGQNNGAGGDGHGHEMDAREEGSASDAALVMAEPCRPLSSSKDKCLLALACLLVAFALFSVYIPTDGHFASLLDSTAPSVGYPLARLAVEVGWSILLYYLLTTNSPAPSKAAQSLERTQKAAALAEEAPAESTVRPKASLPTMMSNDGAEFGAGADHYPATPDEWPLPIRVLKWPYWNVLVKLNYATMLTHFSLFRVAAQTQRDLLIFNWFNFVQMFVFLAALSYLIGLVLHLLVEIPLTAMVQVLVARVLQPNRAPKG